MVSVVEWDERERARHVGDDGRCFSYKATSGEGPYKAVLTAPYGRSQLHNTRDIRIIYAKFDIFCHPAHIKIVNASFHIPPIPSLSSIHIRHYAVNKSPLK
jgi:hypothetical protein